MTKRMKRKGKSPGVFLAFVLVLCLSFGGSSVRVFAEEYTYQVTFYSGNQGAFCSTEGLYVNNMESGSDYSAVLRNGAITVSGLKRGDIVSFDVQSGAVELPEDSKYYIRGVRQSGRDNDTVQSSAFHVEGDAEYVVAYGIRGNLASYTVQYQDTEGNILAPSRTYYGNVGDKPVVAYLYVEGYNPQTLALTKTLSENEAENVFTFVYTPVPTEVITEPGETVVHTTTVTEPVSETAEEEETNTLPDTGAGGEAGDETDAAADAGTGADAAADAGTGAEGTADEGAEDTAAEGEDGTGDETTDISEEEVPQGTQDLTDLDEEEVPQANQDLDKEKMEKNLPMVAFVGLGVLAAAALGTLVFVVRKKMKAS